MFETELVSTSSPESQLSCPIARLSTCSTMHRVVSQQTGSPVLPLSPFQNPVCYQVPWISLPEYLLNPSTLHLFAYLHGAVWPSHHQGLLPGLLAPSLPVSSPSSTLQAERSFRNTYLVSCNRWLVSPQAHEETFPKHLNLFQRGSFPCGIVLIGRRCSAFLC